MYLLVINQNNFMKFQNQFDAFVLVKALYAENNSLNFDLITIQSGYIHDLSWLKP